MTPSSVSTLRAKVIDEKGNPVGGEDVTFSIRNTDTGGFVQVSDPYLAETSAETDGDGHATVRFYPGAFTTDREDPEWSGSARGGCDVVATWNGTTRTIPLTWENYPYLSVEAEAVPGTVNVTDTVDVTVRLRGDGWALQPDPIDVILVMDRSGSMADDNPSRISSAKTAAKTFVAEMSPARDRIGLVQYGNDASCALHLTHDYSSVNTTINALTPSGWTATRKALYTSIQEMIAHSNPDPDAVQAVILLSDGEYNYYGDPLARGEGRDKYDWTDTRTDRYTFFEGLGGSKEADGGLHTNQNMSVYAENNNIRLYMISFSNGISEESPTWKTMDTLAGATGGKHYHAATGADLAAIYSEIAGELKTEAGVNTAMTLDFSTIQVNDEDREGETVFTYVHEDGISTTIESWVDNETGHHEIIPLETVDQTDDWNDDHTLQFNIGTVHLGQTWEATFRLKVLTDGNINVFGPNSAVTFNDGTDTLPLPDTFITAVPDLTNTGLGSATLGVSNPRYTCAEPVLELLTVAWDLAYTGSGTVTESVEYSNDGGLSWVRFDTPTANSGVTSEASSLDVGDLPPGEYLVRIRASADDAPDAGALFPPIRVGEHHTVYIRLA